MAPQLLRFPTLPATPTTSPSATLWSNPENCSSHMLAERQHNLAARLRLLAITNPAGAGVVLELSDRLLRTFDA